MGAGISLSAGAPTWVDLIEHLAQEVGVEPEVRETLVVQDVLDQAAYVEQEFARRGGEREFAAAVIKAVDVQRYGPAPALLAALETEQAITLNYDQRMGSA